MNLQPKRDTITVQKEFLNTTQGMVNKVGGGTLGAGFTGDASGMLKAGSGVTLPGPGQALVPYDGVATGTHFVTAHDVKAEEGNIVGLLESAYLKRSVVDVAETGRVRVTDAFATASNGRFHLR